MNKSIREAIKRIPVLGDVVRRAYWKLKSRRKMHEHFPGSAEYWNERYSAGGDSGVGSYGQFAKFKADVLNEFIAAHQVHSIIEFGCGDGNQLRLAKYPAYLGLDVSNEAVSRCRALFESDIQKSFRMMNEYADDRSDLALSLDVIYHLVEDEVYENYMRVLFEAADRFVIVYSSNFDDDHRNDGAHVRHRKFTKWIDDNIQNFRLIKHLPNRYPFSGDYIKGSFAEFFFYERTS